MSSNLLLSDPHILVVDDDRRLRELIGKYLGEKNMRVGLAANSAQARAYLASHNPDLIILDIMMPGEDGLALTRSIRSSINTPILLLSARDRIQDRIEGLDFGADDYLTKPFEPEELVARIKAILRRALKPNQLPEADLFFGDFRFDTINEILYHHREPIHLQSTEAILLKTLAQSPRQSFSRHDLAVKVGHRLNERSIDVQITRLRRKINDDPRQPRYIRTVRYIGYALFPDEN